MITQQELVNRLNQLTLRYNLTWSDIKYDADKAIHKINNFLGTRYPSMSSILLSATSTYSLGNVLVDTNVTTYEIFPEEYIHSIVIPFIAMEILARDEEFTTIYSKYATEVEDGLFHMFQNEFNKVPPVFRQSPDAGVFFPSDSAQGRIMHNRDKDLPKFVFRVYYHVNNPEIVFPAGTDFTRDVHAYEYGETHTVTGWTTPFITLDGASVYIFQGWVRSRELISQQVYQEGNTIEVLSDIHLYAKWERISTLDINVSGSVRIKQEYAHLITTLVIPEYINGRKVTTISSDFAMGKPTIKTIIVPKTVTIIGLDAFAGFTGHTITIMDNPDKHNQEWLHIETDAFRGTPNLHVVTLPKSVTSINKDAFPAQANKHLIINVAYLQGNVPGLWVNYADAHWYAPSNPNINYTVEVRWGYNG